MTGFELLAYVVSFSIILGITLFIVGCFVIVINRKRAVEDFKSGREKRKHKIDL